MIECTLNTTKNKYSATFANNSKRPVFDIRKAIIPNELVCLRFSEKKKALADRYHVTTDLVTIHKDKHKGQFSVYPNGKPKASYDDIQYFQKKREEKKERQQALKEEPKDTSKRGWYWFPKPVLKTEKESFAKECKLTLAKDRERIRKHALARWKAVSMCPIAHDDEQMLWNTCKDIENREILIEAMNLAEDLFCKSTKGYFRAQALRDNKMLVRVLKLRNGERLLGGILECIDESYIIPENGVKGRTQRYKLGAFVPYLQQLQDTFDIPDKTLDRSVEAFNYSQIRWAIKKGYEYVTIGGFVYAKINNRYYNKLNNSPRRLLMKRLIAMGYMIRNNDVVCADIDAALPTMMNLRAMQLDPEIGRPSTAEIKSERKILARYFRIPVQRMKKLQAASNSGSDLWCKAEVWDDCDEIDFKLRGEIASDSRLKRNRSIFKENFAIFDKNGDFDFIQDREDRTKASIYSLLYCKLESERMQPVFDYLESLGVLFIVKHDGVDIFSAITEEQKEEIRKIIGISCTITSPLADDGCKNKNQDLDANKFLNKREGDPYDVKHYAESCHQNQFIDTSPCESPPDDDEFDRKWEEGQRRLHEMLNQPRR